LGYSFLGEVSRIVGEERDLANGSVEGECQNMVDCGVGRGGRVRERGRGEGGGRWERRCHKPSFTRLTNLKNKNKLIDFFYKIQMYLFIFTQIVTIFLKNI
jgi:hypothetical protein